MSTPATVKQLDRVVIRSAGDSGDCMQLTGDRFTAETAGFSNVLSTLPDFPAEIRAPASTLPGVSSFQLHFADHDIFIPGDAPDVLVAMNPAALKVNLADLPRGAEVIVDTDDFTRRAFAQVGWSTSPLDDAMLEAYRVHPVALTTLTVEALKDSGLTRKDAERAKNMFALGLLSWMYHRPTEGTEKFLRIKFAKKPELAEVNVTAFRAGWNYGETTESFAVSYLKDPATRHDALLRLEHGKPYRLTPDAGEVVHDVADPDPTADFALSLLQHPTPIGVLRVVRRPAYDRLMDDQLERDVAERGRGDLAALLAGNDTWTVGA